MNCLIAHILGFLLLASIECRKEDQDCSVCEDVLSKVMKKAGDTTEQAKIEKAVLDVCKVLKDSCGSNCVNETKHQNRFCYLIGGVENAQTSIYKMQVAKPLSRYIPTEKVCEKLNDSDQGTCEIKYDKPKVPVDWAKVQERINTQSNKMRVKELKQILRELGGSDKGFTEKSEYIKEIQKLISNKQEL